MTLFTTQLLFNVNISVMQEANGNPNTSVVTPMTVKLVHYISNPKENTSSLKITDMHY